MLSHTRIASVDERARSRFGLLGGLAAGAGLLLAIAVGCSSSSPSSPPGSSVSPGNGLCGNGIIDPNEVCDGANLGNATCGSVTMGAFPVGVLTCSSCQLDMSSCTSGAPGAGGGVGTSGTPGTSGYPSVGTGGGPSTSNGGTPGQGGF